MPERDADSDDGPVRPDPKRVAAEARRLRQAPTYRSGTASVPADNHSSTPEQRAAALEFLRDLAVEVSSGTVDLPCFPNVVARVCQALSDPQTTAEQTVLVIGAEPRLAARILQTANSAAFNAAGKPLTDLRAGITRLGQHAVQGIAMSYAVHRMQESAALRSIEAPLAKLWDTSVRVAALSQLIARRTRLRGEAAFLAGLLHGIGDLYIMVRTVTSGQNYADLQSWFELVADWAAPIGKAVLESWGFDDTLCEAVGNQSDTARKWRHAAELTDILIVSTTLAEAFDEPPREYSIAGVGAFMTVGIRAEECTALVEQATSDVVRVRVALGME